MRYSVQNISDVNQGPLYGSTKDLLYILPGVLNFNRQRAETEPSKCLKRLALSTVRKRRLALTTVGRDRARDRVSTLAMHDKYRIARFRGIDQDNPVMNDVVSKLCRCMERQNTTQF